MVLSSGCSTNIATFSVKETILHMVLNKILVSQTSLLLRPDNPYSIPTDSVYILEVNSGTWMEEAIARKG